MIVLQTTIGNAERRKKNGLGGKRTINFGLTGFAVPNVSPDRDAQSSWLCAGLMPGREVSVKVQV